MQGNVPLFYNVHIIFRNFGNGKREIQKKKSSDLFEGQIIVPMLKKQEVVLKLKVEESENFCSKEQVYLFLIFNNFKIRMIMFWENYLGKANAELILH